MSHHNDYFTIFNGMERRSRAATETASAGLLRRQLASIADTLDKAMRAGERESYGCVAKARDARAPPVARISVSELSFTSGFELGRGSDDTEGPVEVEQASGGGKNIASNVQSVATHTTTITGELSWNIMTLSIIADHYPDVEKTLASLCIGYDSDESDSDSWKDGADYANPKMMLAELGRASQSFKKYTREAADDGDPKRMLVEIEGATIQATQTTSFDDDDVTDLKAMLDLGANQQSPTTSCTTRADEELRLQEMFEKLTASTTDKLKVDKDTNNEFGCPKHTFPTRIINVEEDAGLEKECIPYAVALRLESAMCKWKDVQDWFTYLFSTGMNSYDAQVQKEEMVKRENEKLDAIIEYVLEKEKRYREIEDKERLPYRLIASNLAADTDEEAIRMFFSEYRWDM
jgi:hypothetical protein